MEKLLNDVLGDHRAMEFTTKILMEERNDGEWLVRQSITQRVSDDMKTWDERTADFEAKDRLLDKALAEAAVLATLYLESVNYDLFTIDVEMDEGEYLQ
jgi:hypothetical protein